MVERTSLTQVRRSAPRSWSLVSSTRSSGRTSATSSMYGDSMPGSMSKYLLAWSSSTAGANGRNDSRYLILRFMIDCVADERPVTERTRPELHPPLEESDDVAVGDRPRDPLRARRTGESFVGVAA